MTTSNPSSSLPSLNPLAKKRCDLQSSQDQDTSAVAIASSISIPPLTSSSSIMKDPSASAHSPIDDIIETFQNLNGEQEWAQFTISPQEYKTIRVFLAKFTNQEQGPFEGKEKEISEDDKSPASRLKHFLINRSEGNIQLIYEYIPQTSTLAFRMPLTLHNVTAQHFLELSLKVVRNVISNYPNMSSFKQKLEHGMTGMLNEGINVWKVKGKWKELYPDAAIQFFLSANDEFNDEGQTISCNLPGVIFEIGYSQTWESLRNYVRYYLLDTNKCINKVVIVKIDPKTRRTFLELWERYMKTIEGKEYWDVRMCKYRQEVKREDSTMEIRGLDGSEGAQIDESIKFKLADLAPFLWLEKEPQLFETPWELSIRSLYRLLNNAFEKHDRKANDLGFAPPDTPTPILDDDM
ncbi:hypothetical protein DSL72_002426 [Monilinia vaccinii-corymbosi]|uniref:Uncharacterized protein n=1 Tax=Monilinia vaccinii-corymbosi TaxID=61207 RepID=A0A8A3PCM2_9HELO|nr:hypothetical protein DSL72_002426 [Monilinia vaccinii-corymbosi]